ncbi:extracellular lipase [Xylariaceae sp. FL1019]|nr:extracellular lipase [Xylariaceae sp. FL1019]
MKAFNWALLSSYALLAATSPIERIKLQRDSVDLDTFKLYAQYSGAAYCNSQMANGATITCSNNVCPDVTSAGATVQATFSGSDTDLQGFVAVDPGHQAVVVSMRGSSSLDNFITDFEFFQEDCPLVSGGQVHIGFAKAWDEVSSSVLAALQTATAANPSYRIVFTGHSLGAAVSSLGAAYARAQGYAVDIINFGSPRFGNDILADFVTNQAGIEWRMTHLNDPVPRLPPILFNYRHTSPEYWLSNGEDDTDDYTASDVKVCDGNANIVCNAGTFGLDIISHLNYLGQISGCNALEFIFKRDLAEENLQSRNEDYYWYLATAPANSVSEDELTSKVNEWAAQDMAAN